MPHGHDRPLLMSTHIRGSAPGGEPADAAQFPVGSHGQGAPVPGSVQLMGSGLFQSGSYART